MTQTEIEALQASLKEQLEPFYAENFAALKEQITQYPTRRSIIRQHSGVIDDVLQLIWAEGRKLLKNIPKIAILATGGYGREEMFFYSDIDIMFLVEKGCKKQAEPLISLVLYVLWDLRLKVGHSVREVAEAIIEAQGDTTICTNLLEARRVVGSTALSQQFQRHYQQLVIQGKEREFIDAKLKEWAERHDKHADSRALLEPNIKEGKGGHRDLQTLMWMMRACYGVRQMRQIAALGKISTEELREFRRARKFLQLVRLHLHEVSGRAQEQLSFEAQRLIAERLGYRGDESANQSVERFMKRYFQVTRQVGQLTRTLCLLLEAEWGKAPRFEANARWKRQQLPEGIGLTQGRLQFSSLNALRSNPSLMIEIFWLRHRLEVDIHPATWQMLTRNLKLIDNSLREDKRANDLFMQLLLDARNPLAALKHMNESGVLGKFIPDFGLLVGQMQFDLYHTYTVDEHILIAISNLHRLEAGECEEICAGVAAIFARISMRRVVYLAIFCHDIAKGRGGSHHLKGVEVGRKLAQRFGFDAEEVQALEWLIEFHQHLSMIAFKRDLDDEETINAFAHQVQSLQMLKMLYVVTLADIQAVGPKIFNNWKASLLQNLYRKTELALGGGMPLFERAGPVEQLKASLQKALPQVAAAHIATYLEEADRSLIASYNPATHERIFPSWLAVHQGEDFHLRFKSYPRQGSTHLTIATRDKRGLFAQISGVLALCGASITDARIHTGKDGIVIDRFAIQDEQAESFAEDRRQERIRQRLSQVLKGKLDLPAEVAQAEARYPSHSPAFALAPKVFFDNDASRNMTLIEVQCLDQRGLLYRLATVLTDAQLSISRAHIATYGEKAVDVFYVKDAAGEKLHDAAAQQALREKIVQALG